MLGVIAHLFSTNRDARLLGAAGSEVSSGQSGLQGAIPVQATPLCRVVIDLFSFLLPYASIHHEPGMGIDDSLLVEGKHTSST